MGSRWVLGDRLQPDDDALWLRGQFQGPGDRPPVCRGHKERIEFIGPRYLYEFRDAYYRRLAHASDWWFCQSCWASNGCIDFVIAVALFGFLL